MIPTHHSLIKTLFKHLADESPDFESTYVFLRKVQSELSEDEARRFVYEAIMAFIDSKVSIKSSKSLMVYLKFFHFVSWYSENYSDVRNACASVIDTFLTHISQLTSVESAARCINPLTEHMIHQVIFQLRMCSVSENLNKKKMYSKLLSGVLSTLDEPYATHIKAAYATF